MQAAPYFEDAAGLPGTAFWLNSDDGVRIRVVFWPLDGAKGTVVIYPGRTEYAEKYGRIAQDLAQRGYAALAIDWRGQGLADRLHKDPLAGHVESFGDYQLDARAVMGAAQEFGMPEPWVFLGHSMGGCIGLRSLMGDHPFRAAAFSAPMWGIQIAAPLRPVASALAAVSRRMGLSHLYPPGKSGASAFEESVFETNLLTTDAESWDWMRQHVEAHPELTLGGPSLHWLHEALAECSDLADLPAPDLPAIAFLGTEEKIVDSNAIRARMAEWRGEHLVTIPGLRHEVLIEAPEVRRPLIDDMVALFDSAAAGEDA